MRLLATTALIATLTSGCYVYASDSGHQDPYSDSGYNFAPDVLDAEAGCYYDETYQDDIWYFDALVDDLDGLSDVTQVWADVYDEYDGSLVESFELYPTADSMVWFSDWIGSSTYLSCYYNMYTVDIVAYDTFEDMDYITVVPYTY
jgi:hypothetical protein